MRCRVVAGENEAQTNLSDKDVAKGACDWSTDLAVRRRLHDNLTSSRWKRL